MHSLHRHNKVTVLLKLVPYEREFSGGAEEKETERETEEGGGGGKTTDFVFRTRVGRVGQDEERTKKCARERSARIWRWPTRYQGLE